MMQRLLDALFRYLRLLVIPPLLIVAIVTPLVVLTARPYYETWAGVWVDRPSYLNYKDSSNPYMTPVQNQSARLAELLRSRAFQVQVARRTPLAPLAATPDGQAEIERVILGGFAMWPNGDHLLATRFRAATPELSYAVLTAILDAFKERVIADRIDQAALATSFYQANLKEAQGDLSSASDELRRYMAANPRLTTLDPNLGEGKTPAAALGLPLAAVDPALGNLVQRVQMSQESVKQVQSSLDAAQLDTAAALQGQQLGFQVVDRPQLPPKSTLEKKMLLIVPAAGLLIGLVISALLLMLIVVTDRSVQGSNDLDWTGTVITVVPYLTLTDLSLPLSADATRHAVGHAARASLSAPSAQPAVQ